MADCPRVPLTVGVHGEYEWLVTEHHLDDLLQFCPQVVLGKYVTITSIDSGPYFPTPEEIAVGWERRNSIAYSPRVEKVETLPREGWDEWYVFEERVDLGGMAARDSNPFEASLSPGEIYAFVNYNFSLSGMQGIERIFGSSSSGFTRRPTSPKATIFFRSSQAIRSFSPAPARLSLPWNPRVTFKRNRMASSPPRHEICPC